MACAKVSVALAVIASGAMFVALLNPLIRRKPFTWAELVLGGLAVVGGASRVEVLGAGANRDARCWGARTAATRVNARLTAIAPIACTPPPHESPQAGASVLCFSGLTPARLPAVPPAFAALAQSVASRERARARLTRLHVARHGCLACGRPAAAGAARRPGLLTASSASRFNSHGWLWSGQGLQLLCLCFGSRDPSYSSSSSGNASHW